MLAAQDNEEPHINLMPLIDVVFVILVMFIIIAPILEIDRIDLAQAGSAPFKETIAAQDNSPISISVDQHDTIFLNKQKVSIAQLSEGLIRAKQRNPKDIPQLFQDKNAHFGTYQAVKNAIENAGFEQLDIILEPSHP